MSTLEKSGESSAPHLQGDAPGKEMRLSRDCAWQGDASPSRPAPEGPQGEGVKVQLWISNQKSTVGGRVPRSPAVGGVCLSSSTQRFDQSRDKISPAGGGHARGGGRATRRGEGARGRCRANVAHIRQSRPDSGLAVRPKSLKRFELFAFCSP